MRFGRFLRRLRPKLPGGFVGKMAANATGEHAFMRSNSGGYRIRRDLVVIPPGSGSAQSAFLMDNAALLMDDEEGGTTWADVFGNLTSALAPAVGAAAGMYASKALGQTARNTGVAVPRGTMVPGPGGMMHYQQPSALDGIKPYLPVIGLGLLAVLFLKRK